MDREVGEGSGGRGGHVEDEQEGVEVRDHGDEERPRKTKTYKGGGMHWGEGEGGGGEGRGSGLKPSSLELSTKAKFS